MVDQIQIETININGDKNKRTVTGQIYRKHWFIHKDENENYSLSHVNSGQRMNAFDNDEACKMFADVLIDDMGIGGSFQRKEDIPKYQQMLVKQFIANLDRLKIEEFSIISSINHTH